MSSCSKSIARRSRNTDCKSPRRASPGINGAADVNRDEFTLRDLRNLTQAGVSLTNLPGLYYRLLKTDSATRVLANPQLRTSEGIAAQARFGERVPVPVTVFAPIAAGGVQTQPITSFNYENIGVNIDITPRTHHDDDVSLAVRIEVSNVSGVGFQNLPTFGTRLINTVIRLKDGETNMLAGLIRDDEREVLAGIPGLERPARRRAACSRTITSETQQTDIILTLTPRIVRVLDLRAGGSAALPRRPRRRRAADRHSVAAAAAPARRGLPEGILPPVQQTAPPRSPLLPGPAAGAAGQTAR